MRQIFVVTLAIISAWAETTSATEGVSRADSVSEADMEVVRQRYWQWVLDGPNVDYSHRHVAERYRTLQRLAGRALDGLRENIDFEEPAELYDTRRTGADQSELEFLVKVALPNLAIAYQLRGPDGDRNPYYHDETIRQQLLACFDRLHARGFRHAMLMPWKAREVEGAVADKAVVVDFHLRTSGYALATFLMREELAATDRLERTLRTCREVLSHGEKFGDPGNLKQNADGVRIVVNVALPYALAAGDSARLRLVCQQIDRSMEPESNAADTIKPDGLGYHHRGVYMSGYSAFAVSQSAFIAWLFEGTELACAPHTIANLSEAMAVLRIVSNKYDMHKALAGRLREIRVIPNVMMGYGYLAAIEHPRRDEFLRILARLSDEEFLQRPDSYKAFAPHRNEVPPGPGAIDAFLRTLTKSARLGAEPAPNGHWAFNYGPISVHRRDEWMVSVKGHSRYLWAFERSLTDARLDERMQNVLGFHDSSAAICIHLRGEPINALESGYARDGWDWCRVPGATTRLIPANELRDLDRRSEGKPLNRPFGPSAFAGGVSLRQRYGVFAMQYREVAPDRRRDGLQAMKALFFFDDQIVVVTRGISNGDGKYLVGTTLYQCQLPSTMTRTWIRGNSVTGRAVVQRFDDDVPLTLVDPVGNGYYVPRANGIVVRRSRQYSLDYTATKSTEGDFAAAWFDHGVSPNRDECHYVILVGSGPDRLTQFAEDANKLYSIVQRNSRAIIVAQHDLGLTGYVLPRAEVEIEEGLIARVSAPCLAMTQRRGEAGMIVSVCNPDLGWESGRQFNFRSKDGYQPPTQPVAMPVRLTLRGNWKLAAPHAEVQVVDTDGETTTIAVGTSDARSIEFQLGVSRPSSR